MRTGDENHPGDVIVVWHVKLPRATCNALVRVLAALLEIQLPAMVPGKTEDEPSSSETSIKFQDPGLGLAQPSPVQ